MSRERHGDKEAAKPPVELGAGALWVGGLVAAVFVISRVAPFSPVRDALGWYREMTEGLLTLAEWVFREYGYLATFLAPLVENSFLLGLLIPGAVIMVVAGLGAHDGLINPFVAAPLGVAGRNSDNTFIRQVLGWEPGTPLDQGLAATYAWIKEQYERRKQGKRVVD